MNISQLQAQDSNTFLSLELKIEDHDKELLWSGVALSLMEFGLYKGATPLSYEQWIDLDLADIPNWDLYREPENDQWSEILSDVTGFGSFALPATIIAANFSNPSEWQQMTLEYAEVFLLTQAITGITKYGFQKPRPTAYYATLEPGNSLSKSYKTSFISGHSSFSSANSFYFLFQYRRLFPDSSWKPIVTTACVLLPAVTAYTRVKSGNHFLSDVVAGYITGGLIAFSVDFLHRQESFSFGYSQNGIGLHMILDQ